MGCCLCTAFSQLQIGANFQPIFATSGVAPFNVKFIAFDCCTGNVIGTVGGGIILFQCGEIVGYYANSAAPPNGVGIIISNLNLGGPGAQLEYVQVQNTGLVPVDLTGWTIQSSRGGQTFTFPPGYVLQPGQSVFVQSGALAFDDPPTYLLWTNANVWNNNGDTAVLFDASGAPVSVYSAQ
ncbi:beta-lactamase domain-containing protein [Fictibacillus macauensis ZFHKF-1]|uniref:Beta-lactamase domain-containing protein n=1 Tax=Fictibacillus macauensis ZFHKF-1 TaxID=1196324 RepID=I8AM51_9BACL|nr:beta-lactamase domain-containing protein [Fictibacillus macauensis ZFHKF-1]